MVHAIRAERTETVCVSNYRKNGSRFRNNISLHPLRTTHGSTVRYIIGLSSDADADAREEQDLQLMRKLVPISCPDPKPKESPQVALMPSQADSEVESVTGSGQDPHIDDNSIIFTHLLCIESPHRWFGHTIRTPSVMNAYMTSDAQLFVLPSNPDPKSPLTEFQLVRCSVEMQSMDETARNGMIATVWQGA